jgi:hypothetical protein
MWESRLSGSARGRVATRTTGEIMWHRRETRRLTENTNFALPSGECPVYSKPRCPRDSAILHTTATREMMAPNAAAIRVRATDELQMVALTRRPRPAAVARA